MACITKLLFQIVKTRGDNSTKLNLLAISSISYPNNIFIRFTNIYFFNVIIFIVTIIVVVIIILDKGECKSVLKNINEDVPYIFTDGSCYVFMSKRGSHDKYDGDCQGWEKVHVVLCYLFGVFISFNCLRALL